MTNPLQKIQLSNPAHLLATGFGSGLFSKMPGTVGTLAAIPFYLIFVSVSFNLLLLVIAVGVAVGVYVCGVTARDMGVHDHGSIVWDEFIGFWITMLLVPSMEWQVVLLGFVWFRLFDILKPWPISWLDKKVHGGFGIMLDDILAGIFAMLALKLSYVLFLS